MNGLRVKDSSLKLHDL